MITSTTRRPLFARFYRKVAPLMERRGLADQRERLFCGLAGDVIEIGAGDGRNLAHFPTDVTRVLAVEPEPVLRERALANAAAAPFDVEVVDGVAERLGVRDTAVPFPASPTIAGIAVRPGEEGGA